MPDLRNLGTILRILLAVNATVFVAAMLTETRWEAISDLWLQMSALVEPQLLFQLLVLYAIAPVLLRLQYRVAATVVMTVTLVVTLAWNTVLATMFSEVTTTVLLRRVTRFRRRYRKRGCRRSRRG